MAFNDVAGVSPQPAILTVALDGFCKYAAIEPDSYEYDVARQLILSLYRKGATTAEALTAAVENVLLREGERL